MRVAYGVKTEFDREIDELRSAIMKAEEDQMGDGPEEVVETGVKPIVDEIRSAPVEAVVEPVTENPPQGTDGESVG